MLKEASAAEAFAAQTTLSARATLRSKGSMKEETNNDSSHRTCSTVQPLAFPPPQAKVTEVILQNKLNDL